MNPDDACDASMPALNNESANDGGTTADGVLSMESIVAEAVTDTGVFPSIMSDMSRSYICHMRI